MTDCGDRTVEGPWWGRPGFVRWVGLMALVVVVAIELPMWFRGPPVQAAFGLIVLGAFVILIALALAVSVGPLVGKMVGNATWLRLLAPSAPVGTTARRRVLRQLADADVRALLRDRTDIRLLCPTFVLPELVWS